MTMAEQAKHNPCLISNNAVNVNDRYICNENSFKSTLCVISRGNAVEMFSIKFSFSMPEKKTIISDKHFDRW